MLDRRALLTALAAAPGPAGNAVWPPSPTAADLNSRINALEQRSGGRLGVAALDTQTGRRFAWRATSGSACAAPSRCCRPHVLRRVDQGRDAWTASISYGKDVLMGNSPVVEKHVGGGHDGGRALRGDHHLERQRRRQPAARRFRRPRRPDPLPAGDRRQTTRCDRREPELNTGAADDLRDTTTPTAILATWKTLLLDDALALLAPPADRLAGGQPTGDKRLRAGLPPGWRVGDKTGNNGKDTTNDIAIAWPPGRKPLLIAAFHDRGSSDDGARSKVLADVARAVVATGFGA
jgi:beta-lactamase class A